MTDELKKILARVQKMLAIAQDSRADPNEAATAAAQAEKLMRKYQIDHADVVTASFKQSDSFETRDVVVAMRRGQGHLPKEVPKWGQWLSVNVAKMHDCHVANVGQGAPGARLRFYGYGPDVECCAWAFNFLIETVIRAVRAYQRSDEFGHPRTKIASNSFRHGFVMALLRSIDAVIAQREAETRQSAVGTALVVAKTSAVAGHFGEFKYGSAKRSDALVDGAAFTAGVTEGKKVAVDRRVVGTTQNQPTCVGQLV